MSDLRATLGQLAKVYGTEFLLSADDLEAFVKNRNLIVHDYWRLPPPIRSCTGWLEFLESPKKLSIRWCHLQISRSISRRRSVGAVDDDLGLAPKSSHHTPAV